MNTRFKRVAGIIVALASMFAFVWFQELRPMDPVASEIDTRAAETAVTIGDATVIARLAITADERSQGLSGRASLSETEAMLFFFDEDARHSFWMKDMLISIDIIWISKDKQVVHIVPNASPTSYPASFSSDDNARYVLEVPAGWAKRHGVQLGSIATF